ncbi:hypothetical protein [Gemmatimonas aurantiaca]|uniref:hypothetical protein n=1 Tax=Gemmatimonas aurantiaca TaxID=173480 RepID=UPI00301D6D91
MIPHEIPKSSDASTWESVLARGRKVVADAVEASGGAWTTEQALEQLGVDRDSFVRWREEGRVLALEGLDEALTYPVAQFTLSGRGELRPHPVMQRMVQRAQARLSPEELFGLLTAPQPMLVDADGHPLTPLEAIASGNEDGALRLLDWVLTSSDAGAPPISAERARELGHDSSEIARRPS